MQWERLQCAELQTFSTPSFGGSRGDDTEPHDGLSEHRGVPGNSALRHAGLTVVEGRSLRARPHRQCRRHPGVLLAWIAAAVGLRLKGPTVGRLLLRTQHRLAPQNERWRHFQTSVTFMPGPASRPFAALIAVCEKNVRGYASFASLRYVFVALRCVGV